MPPPVKHRVPRHDTGLLGTVGYPGYYHCVVQHGTAVPPSRQVAASLRERISSGALAPGSKLPSIVNLAAEYRTSTGTIQKALAILRNDGLIVSVPNYGTFVADD